jgi:hypothetical protein
MATPRIGFVPSRQVPPDWVRNVPVNALAKEVAKGDAVTMLNGSVLAASAGTNPTKQGFGVVLAVYTTAGRPLTFQNTKYISSGGVGRADVCFHPDMTYYVQCVTSVGGSNIGTNVAIDVSAANATTGLSGMSVDLVASASTNELFKIINIGPFDSNSLTGRYSQGVTGGGANNGVEVKWNYHFLHAPTAGI